MRRAIALPPQPLGLFLTPHVVDFKLRPDMQALIADWKRLRFVTVSIINQTAVRVMLTDAGRAAVARGER